MGFPGTSNLIGQTEQPVVVARWRQIWTIGKTRWEVEKWNIQRNDILMNFYEWILFPETKSINLITNITTEITTTK